MKDIVIVGGSLAGARAAETLREEGFDGSIRVVGDELFPAFQDQDFTPYVKRAMAAQAQALITGNWGEDLQRLVRCMIEQGAEAPLYAYYPSLQGVPKTLAHPERRFEVYQVACGYTSQPGPLRTLGQAFRRETGEDLVVYAAYDGVSMLIHAMRFAESIDAARVAARISGMLFKGFNGPVQVDPFDHQLQKGVYIAHWQKVSEKYPVAAEATAFTFAPVRYFEAGQLSMPSRCRMRRP